MLRVEPRLYNSYKPAIKGDEKKKSSTQVEIEEQQSSNSQMNKSKGLQYVENRQVTTAQLNGPLKPTANQTITTITPEQKAQNLNTPTAQTLNTTPNQVSQKTSNINSNYNTNVSTNSINRPVSTQINTTDSTQNITPVQQPAQAVRSPKVNIAQIIKDFKNTANAIGTPDDTYEEVKGYLGLVETQVKKDEPNVKLVQSNLRNASVVLDKYISDTLNKDSKVVENWVEAVFLQQVNYKYNESEINEDLMVKIPGENKNSAKTNSVEEIPESVETQSKTDDTLKELMKQAKASETSTQALETYNQALNRSIEIEDKSSQGKIHFEIAKVYDKEDDTDKAIENYSKALSISDDLNVKTKAHFEIAKIYDEQKNYTKAIDNYVDTIGFAGETNNLTAQTNSLTKIANIYADNYDNNAFKIYDEAKDIADTTKSPRLKGYVSSNTAKACEKFNKFHSAYNLYTDAANNYQEAELPEKAAVNFKRAANAIKDVQPQKAESSFKKALSIAIEIKDKNLIKDINQNFLYS